MRNSPRRGDGHVTIQTADDAATSHAQWIGHVPQRGIRVNRKHAGDVDLRCLEGVGSFQIRFPDAEERNDFCVAADRAADRQPDRAIVGDRDISAVGEAQRQGNALFGGVVDVDRNRGGEGAEIELARGLRSLQGVRATGVKCEKTDGVGLVDAHRCVGRELIGKDHADVIAIGNCHGQRPVGCGIPGAPIRVIPSLARSRRSPGAGGHEEQEPSQATAARACVRPSQHVHPNLASGTIPNLSHGEDLIVNSMWHSDQYDNKRPAVGTFSTAGRHQKWSVCCAAWRAPR